MAPYRNLSLELLLEILRHVDRSTLPSLCLTSRSLHSLTQPILYSTFIQPYGGTKSTFLFLRTLAIKPELAGHVKNLEFSVYSNADWGLWGRGIMSHHAANECDYDASLIPEEGHAWIRQQIQGALGRQFENLCDQWYAAICQPVRVAGYKDALIGLVTYICSQNLEVLTVKLSSQITIPDMEYLYFLEASWWKHGDEEQSEHNEEEPYLREQEHLNPIINEYPIARPRSAPRNFTIRFQSKFLEAEFVNEGDASWLFTTFFQPFRLRMMKTKRMSVVTSHPANIGTGISDPSISSSLESFHLKRQPPQHNEDFRYLIPAQVKRKLGNSSNTLQELILEDPFHVWGEDTELDESIINGRLGTMLQFKQLRTLNVQESMILGRATGSISDTRLRHSARACADFANGLPPSLERLIITKCTGAIFDAIYELLFNSSRWPKKLETIELVSPTEILEPIDQTWDNFVSDAREKGVLLQREEQN